MRKLFYSSLGLSLLLTIPVRAQETSPEAIFRKAIAAQGGEKLLSKYQAWHNRTKGKMHTYKVSEGKPEVTEFTSEVDVQLPDKFRSIVQVHLEKMTSRIVQVFDGKKGWVEVPGNSMELDEQGMKEIRELLHLARVVDLVGVVSDKSFQLAPLGEAKVKDKDAVGVRVSYKGYRDLNVYFDKKRGYLLKTEGRGLKPGAKKEGNQEQFGTQERYFLDFREAEGCTLPWKMEVYLDGKLFVEEEVLERRLLKKLDDSTFKRP